MSNKTGRPIQGAKNPNPGASDGPTAESFRGAGRPLKIMRNFKKGKEFGSGTKPVPGDTMSLPPRAPARLPRRSRR